MQRYDKELNHEAHLSADPELKRNRKFGFRARMKTKRRTSLF